jgi:hypothetical protein
LIADHATGATVSEQSPGDNGYLRFTVGREQAGSVLLAGRATAWSFLQTPGVRANDPTGLLAEVVAP